LVDLNREVDQVEPMLRRLIGEDIEIVVVRGKNLGRVMADPGQVNQVLLNLALNARDAMPSGGLLTILTANTPGTMSGNGGVGKSPHDDSVMLEVRDSGCGMDEATAAQIFEPFFTTKGEGKGTGLGLATVYGIVKQSGATISVHSAPEMGTTFRIVFPVADAIDPTLLLRERPETTDAGSETILLVEDDNSVRDLTQRVLEMRGYNVLPARDGADGLRIASGPDVRIDLIVTDVVMPGMNGREFVEAIHGRTPGIPVLYMSGYTDDDILRRGLNDSSVAFLQKPFNAKSLARLVRSVLDAR
jgi:CheY-like chemotaxis protein